MVTDKRRITLIALYLLMLDGLALVIAALWALSVGRGNCSTCDLVADIAAPIGLIIAGLYITLTTPGDMDPALKDETQAQGRATND